MVAVTKAKDFKELKSQLKKGETVAIFSCNTCTRSMRPPTGGLEAVEKLRHDLEDAGFKVADKIYLTAACFEDYIDDYIEADVVSDNWTTGIVLACESGFGVVKKHLPKRKIIRGLETLGILMKDGKKHWKSVVELEM